MFNQNQALLLIQKWKPTQNIMVCDMLVAPTLKE
jgi:hypothetical protein